MKQYTNGKFGFKIITLCLFLLQTLNLHADKDCNPKGPSGDYQKNCKDCGYDNKVLAATCQDSKKKWHYSTIDTKKFGPPYTVDKNGVLTGVSLPKGNEDVCSSATLNNQTDANTNCPKSCTAKGPKYSWNGQWVGTSSMKGCRSPGSVCGCAIAW